MSFEEIPNIKVLSIQGFAAETATKPASPGPAGWSAQDLLSPSLRHFPLADNLITVPEDIPETNIKSYKSIAEKPFPRWPCEENVIWQAWQDRIGALVQLRMFKIANAELNSLSLIAREKMPWDMTLILAHFQGVDAMWRLMNNQETRHLRRVQCCLLLAGQLTLLREWSTIELVLRKMIAEFSDTPHLPHIQSALCRSSMMVGNIDLASEFAKSPVDLAILDIFRGEDSSQKWNELSKVPELRDLAINNLGVLHLGLDSLDSNINSLTSVLPSACEPLLYNLATMYELRTNNSGVLKDDLLKLLREEVKQTRLDGVEGLSVEYMKL